MDDMTPDQARHGSEMDQDRPLHSGVRPPGAAQRVRSLSEVAAELDVAQHVLRFWESKFPQIEPVKRAGGARFYRGDDIDLLSGIRFLLLTEGLTIKGVQKVLTEQGPDTVRALGRTAPKAERPKPAPAPGFSDLPFSLVEMGGPDQPAAAKSTSALTPTQRAKLHDILSMLLDLKAHVAERRYLAQHPGEAGGAGRTACDRAPAFAPKGLAQVSPWPDPDSVQD